jgi:hypothetical protein
VTFGVRPPGRLNRIDAVIAPGTALCFSLFVSFLAPRYTQWYGDAMPPLTREFIDRYPTYIAITVGGVILQVIGKMLAQRGIASSLWKSLDTVLAAASILIIIVGIVALSLPLFTMQLPIGG